MARSVMVCPFPYQGTSIMLVCCFTGCLALCSELPLFLQVPSLSPAPIHTPNRWSPNVPTPPPHAPPNVATTALLQARLLAQQRSSGIFPSGQVAQLVRPSAVPVYQAGVQAGLPLQSAALLSQFVWLNVL